MVSGGFDGTVRIWDAATGDLIGEPLTNGTVLAVAIGRAGDRDVIVSGGYDGTVRLWDAVRSRPIHLINVTGQSTGRARRGPTTSRARGARVGYSGRRV
ncbi:MAG: hypothetical protein IRY85_19160 [Micromonosporaceae bacterium]|nr:hypothetical protein [Micromonosporaceae bacterium]